MTIMFNANYLKSINNYHQKRWQRIRCYADSYAKKGDDKSLHQLRVEIKKLKSLIHFLEFKNAKFHDKELQNSLGKIFKLLGEKRDYRNALSFCKQFGIKKSMLTNKPDSSKKISKKIEKLLETTTELSKKIEENIPKTKVSDLEKYLSLCHKDISSVLTSPKVATNLHEARKKMKDILYLSKLMEKDKKSFISTQELKILEQMQDLIGQVHDLNIFCSNLKNFFVNEPA